MRQASKNFGQLSLIESDRNVASVDMTNEETRDLALRLLAADEESEAIESGTIDDCTLRRLWKGLPRLAAWYRKPSASTGTGRRPVPVLVARQARLTP